MNHRPFEDWLLDEQPLTPEQTRELQIHLQDCAHCAALDEVNLELRSVKMAAPAAGFAARFQKRLAGQRLHERRNRLVGVLILAAGGAGLLGWSAAPYVIQFLASPAVWIAAAVNFLLTLLSMARAIGELGSILARVLPGFIPPFGWLVLASALSGAVLLWVVSIWRFTRFSRGV
ncbi:MAG: hypothetical protein A3K45_08760 [Chloroflexi bacterium RIFOXYC12_FULL_59_14]|nr:MAG: hypothetical protein A3K45_08760 [Chloroflexi bacterium RIFOXYC12_FULL_59_14]